MPAGRRLAADLVAWWAARSRDVDWMPGGARSTAVVGVGELRAVLVRLTVGQQASEELPDLAARVLAGGEVDSPLLRELAGLSAREVREAGELFVAMMAELGVEAPVDGSCEQLARFWAQEMLAGTVSPYEASSYIWWRAWEPLGRPSHLTGFVGLASMWQDDPDGRTRYERDMLSLAERLISRVISRGQTT